MNSQMNFCLIGGAGYVGIHLTYYLKKKFPSSQIFIITQNTTKGVFFRMPNVVLTNNISQLRGLDIYVINLAYSIGDFYSDTKIKNLRIYNQIKDLSKENNILKLVHVSSIVLSDNENLAVSHVRRNDTYYFAKSFIEQKICKYVKANNIPTVILRSGNIMGPGSPWVSTIIERLIASKPLIGAKKDYPSQTTFVGNLVYAISELLFEKQVDNVLVMNFCEFSEVSWLTWIKDINKKYNIPVIEWKVQTLNEVKPSIMEDVCQVFSPIKSDIILRSFKGKRLNNIILKFVDILRLKRLKGSSKTKVRSVKDSINTYMNLMEYNVARVYMNENTNILENVPATISDNIPYTYNEVVEIIEKWLEFAGYNQFNLK